MPADSLTADLWLATLDRVDKPDRTTKILCELLEDIIVEIDDPNLGRILDIHAGRILP